MLVVFGEELDKALTDLTFQNPFEKKAKCHKCGSDAKPILLISDEDGELAHSSPNRDDNGKPIWPHDSCAFALYMCRECGKVTVDWNQG